MKNPDIKETDLERRAKQMLMTLVEVQDALNSGLIIGDPQKIILEGRTPEFVEILNRIQMAIYAGRSK